MSWRFITCAALFVTCLLTANTIATKLITVGGVVLTAGIVIFPLSYVLGDVLTEVWGYAAARRVIWLGFACNARIVAASFAGYLAGEFANSFVLAKLKILTRGRWLWTRTIGSTLVGQAFDTVIFVTLAFAGTVPAGALAALVIAQWAVKVAYEAAATPLTYAAVAYLKTSEQVDTY